MNERRYSRNRRCEIQGRLVAKGYNQVKGVDLNYVFSLIVNHGSICGLLGLVAMHNSYLEKLDVKTPFLHSELGEQINVNWRESFETEGKEIHVCLLKKISLWLEAVPSVVV